MPPRGSWGASTPQAKPKPKPRAAAAGGPTGGPADGGDLRYPDAGGGGPSHPAMRPPQGVLSDPRAAGAPPAVLPAAAAGSVCVGAQGAPSSGMFDGVPMYGAMRRPVAASDGRLPLGMFTGQCPRTVVSDRGALCAVSASPMAAADPPLGSPSCAAVPICQGPPTTPRMTPAPMPPAHGCAWPGAASHAAAGGWSPVLAAAAHDAPVPGPAAAAPAAAALPDAAALDHGNHPSRYGGGGAVRFGSVDQVDEEDEMWGDWSSGRVLCGARPTELDNACGYGGDGDTGWGSGAPAGTADGRFDGEYPACPPGFSAGNVGGSAPPFSAPGHPVRRTQTTRWATGTFRRTPSADVRVIDAQRASVEPARWSSMGPPAGTPPLGPWSAVRTVLDPSRPPTSPPAPLLVGSVRPRWTCGPCRWRARDCPCPHFVFQFAREDGGEEGEVAPG